MSRMVNPRSATVIRRARRVYITPKPQQQRSDLDEKHYEALPTKPEMSYQGRSEPSSYTFHNLPHVELRRLDSARFRSKLRREYATKGAASGIDPGLLWPSENERQELMSDPELPRPTREQAIQDAVRAIEEEKQATIDRIQEVEDKLQSYPKILDQYKQQIREKELEAQEAEASRLAKTKEIQEYFGYAVDDSDPRFLALLKQKEAAELKAIKLAKKAQQKAKMIAQLESAAE